MFGLPLSLLPRAYDPVGNLVSVTDPNGHTTSYAYDDANNLTAATAPDATTTTYGWADWARRCTTPLRPCRVSTWRTKPGTLRPDGSCSSPASPPHRRNYAYPP